MIKEYAYLIPDALRSENVKQAKSEGDEVEVEKEIKSLEDKIKLLKLKTKWKLKKE